MREVSVIGAIPDHVRDDLGRTGLAAVMDYYHDPANEQRYQAWLKGYKKRKTTNMQEGERHEAD